MFQLVTNVFVKVSRSAVDEGKRRSSVQWVMILSFVAYDDQSRDADLMADSLIERKDRFLCITRAYVQYDNRNLVVEDVKVISERETPPANYIPLTQTMDTLEKGTAKRFICVKLEERQAGMKCICDIIFLYRSKRTPQSYTIIGEINGLQMCVREGVVPPLRVAPSNLYPNPAGARSGPYFSPGYQHQTSSDNGLVGTLTKKSDEKEILDGVPFQINPKYLVDPRNRAQAGTDLDSMQILTQYDIEKFFNYDFHLERASLEFWSDNNREDMSVLLSLSLFWCMYTMCIHRHFYVE